MKLNHRTIKNMLPEFRSGTLSKELVTRVAAHLALCEDCRKELSLIAVLDKADVPAPGDQFWTTLAQKVRTTAQEENPPLNSAFSTIRRKFMPGSFLLRLIPVAGGIGLIVFLLMWHAGNRTPGYNQGTVVPKNTSARIINYTDPFATSIIDYSLLKRSDIPSPIQQVQIDKLYPELAYPADSYYSRFASLNAEDLKKLNTMLKNKEKKRS